MNVFNPIWNNVSIECLFIVFCLMFSHCYLVSHNVQFLVIWSSQCIQYLLSLWCSDMALNIICMLMIHISIIISLDFYKCSSRYEHVTSVCWAVYYIHCLKSFLTQVALVTVVHAFLTSRIDYCNSLLYGISDYNINRFQRIQNSAARKVTNTRKSDHISPILQKLRWLPVRQRIYFKILLITYKSISDTAPDSCVNSGPLGSPLENSDNPVRYYCRCLCLGSSYMAVVHLELQSPLCGLSFAGWYQKYIVSWKGCFNR